MNSTTTQSLVDGITAWMECESPTHSPVGVAAMVADMARFLDAPDAWRIELAVTLSQLGGLVLPQSLFTTLRRTGRRILRKHKRIKIMDCRINPRFPP